MYDFIIIGAGVVGSMIARELSKYELKVLLVDKEDDVSCGASKANSGIVHGGYDAVHGTLKSKLVRKGNRMYKELDEKLHFGYSEIGSLVLAFTEEEMDTLKDLLQNGIKNGVDGLWIISKEEVLSLQPNVNKNVVGALYCKTAGVTSPYELTIALAENAIQNGVELQLKAEVTDIEKKNEYFVVTAGKQLYKTKYILNCAGVYSDKIASLIGAQNFTIIPRRGEYILFNKVQGELASHVLFQCPTKEGKGILVTKTYHNNLMIGPDAQQIQDKDDVSNHIENLQVIIDTARKTIKDFDVNMAITYFAGIRASSDRKDFIIEESKVKGFINVAGIDSPGLTSSPAIAQYVVQLIKEMGVTLISNKKFNPYRKSIYHKKDETFSGYVDAEDKKNNIICRCEMVTEAEIVDAMHRGIPIDSVDAIKRRTRAGMGPCQGGFCTPRVTKIIAREAKILEEEVTSKKKKTPILDRITKYHYPIK